MLLEEEVNQLKLENELLKQQLSTFTKYDSDSDSNDEAGVITFQYGHIVFRMIEHVNAFFSDKSGETGSRRRQFSS
jgi:hypothetical protein